MCPAVSCSGECVDNLLCRNKQDDSDNVSVGDCRHRVGSSLDRETLHASDRRAKPSDRTSHLNTIDVITQSVRHQTVCSVACTHRSFWGTPTLPGTESGTSVVAKTEELALRCSLFSHRQAYPHDTHSSPSAHFLPLAALAPHNNAFRSVSCPQRHFIQSCSITPTLHHRCKPRPLTVLHCTSATPRGQSYTARKLPHGVRVTLHVSYPKPFKLAIPWRQSYTLH